ncbi:hypothetical protein P692DRAFT_20227662 [Suillus brevipes Sb2]|nr:hypothetical protein P692DRAFT_20227662 [Suillus brevipes Sb2]
MIVLSLPKSLLIIDSASWFKVNTTARQCSDLRLLESAAGECDRSLYPKSIRK